MNPYGIQQVDVPGLLGVYESAKQNRMRDMMMQRQMQREDAEYERKRESNRLLVDIAKSMQPKGGGRASGVAGVAKSYGQGPQDGGFDARLNAAPEETQAMVQPEQPSVEELMGQLAAIDPETWARMDTRIKDQAKAATSYMAQAVMDVSRMTDETQRAQVWTRYVQQAEANGMDIPTHLERYSPEALNQAAVEAGTMEKLIKSQEPDYMAIPEGGTLVNTRDPQAVASFGRQGGGAQLPRVTSPEQMRGLAPGTEFIAPDGTVRRVPGGAPSQGGASFP
jgi:hypothetical protein